VILAVPVAIPVTTPVMSTGATAALLLLHVPPDTELVKVVVEPIHTLGEPAIAAGEVFTVTVTTRKQPVPNV
jgi:hypothetical protein